MCTLLNSDSSGQPERRTAFVARKLWKFNVGIADLSETRLADEGQLREEKEGYTFFGRAGLLENLGYMVLDLPSKTTWCDHFLNYHRASANA